MALRELTIWGAHWSTAGYPEAIESTKNSCTCYGISEEWVEAWLLKAAAATVFGFGAAFLVVTRSSLLFIVEANVISSLSGTLFSFARYLELGGKYHSMCAHTFCIILSSQPTWPEKAKSHQRLFHEEGHAWFLWGVILIRHLPLLILLDDFLNLASCTSPNSKKAFLTVVSETVVGKNIVMKTAFGTFFLWRPFPPRGGSGRIL